MDTTLRQIAKNHNDAIKFAMACPLKRSKKREDKGSGVRELIALWYRVNKGNRDEQTHNRQSQQ